MRKSDEEIIYEVLLDKFDELANKKHKQVSKEQDKLWLSNTIPKAQLLLMGLNNTSGMTEEERLKKLSSAKHSYVQFQVVRNRLGGELVASYDKIMGELLHSISHHEAEIFSVVRMQELGGTRIDLKEVLEQKDVLNRVLDFPIRTLVRRALDNQAEVVTPFQYKYYITETGKKYHLEGCPYCKGKILRGTTRAMIKNQKLEACRCVERAKKSDENSHDYVTAFVDESLHPVQWDESGKSGNAASFSYVICYGKFQSEKNISSAQIIAQGTEYYSEKKKIDKVTIAAITKVLYILAFEENFIGEVFVFADNMPAVNYWKIYEPGQKLASMFKGVSVSYVPREQNTFADKVGRKRMNLNVPIETYNNIVNRYEDCNRALKNVNELKRELESLRESTKVECMVTQTENGAKREWIHGCTHKIIEFFKVHGLSILGEVASPLKKNESRVIS